MKYYADIWPGHDMNTISMTRDPGPKPAGVVRLSFEFEMPVIEDPDIEITPEVIREENADSVPR